MRLVVPIITLCFLITSHQSIAWQSDKYSFSTSGELFKGFIYKHSEEVGHLITSHPTGFIAELNKYTYGNEPWQQHYNFADMGYTLMYVDYNNKVIGKTVAAMAHYNFYFNKNHNKRSDFKFKLAFGVGYHTNPYDKVENNKNNFLGTPLSFGMQLQTKYMHLVTDRLKAVAGLSYIHFSNASIQRPNKGVNIFASSLGLAYRLNKNKPKYKTMDLTETGEESIKFNLSLSGGLSETTTVGAGSYPFYVFNAYADKRLNHKSALQLGFDAFFTHSIREDIRYDKSLDGELKPDYKRLGLTIGHELFVNKVSLLSQFGYYVYRPYKSFKPVYLRLGVKYYFSEKFFSTFVLKTHFAKAEAAELGIGIRL